MRERNKIEGKKARKKVSKKTKNKKEKWNERKNAKLPHVQQQIVSCSTASSNLKILFICDANMKEDKEANKTVRECTFRKKN
jgi:hypothetical protein